MSPSKTRVLKFGGTSLGSPERLARACDLIRREFELGPIAVVVSAMGDTTDWLLEAAETAKRGDFGEAEQIARRVGELALGNAKETHGANIDALEVAIRNGVDGLTSLLKGIALLKESSLPTTDELLSYGERISAFVLAWLLESQGLEAVFVDARDWVRTNDQFGEARIDFETSRARLLELKGGWGQAIAINTGFLGRTQEGKTTTLGRNGSDYTASLLASCLDASEVQIWTDVPGVMTADPAIVKDAYPLTNMSYMEAVELSFYGTRMFHPRTMVPLIESGIPMRIRSTMDPTDPGTLINASGGREAPTSVTSLENLALLDVEWRRLTHEAQVGKQVLSALEGASIPVWMASQGAHGQSIAIVIPQPDVDAAKQAIQQAVQADLASHDLKPIGVWAPVTLLSLVCDAMRDTPNVAGRFFQALGGVGVNLRAIAQGASSRSISCVIDAADTEVAVRTVHAAFNFADQRVSLLIMGKGVVGSQLLEQIKAQYDLLAQDHGVALKVVGLCGSDRLAFDENGLDLSDWRGLYDDTGPTGVDIEAALDKLRRMPVPILVDCTAADAMERRYLAAFDRGVHVVAANKKPLAEPQAEWQGLMNAARGAHRFYNYETTVGASLPVIDTLKNLVRTGDRVNLVEGCLSGTLGYLTNEVMQDVSLSEAVKEAKALGYTEPQPQDDLSGLDVARKALILARELGLELDLSDVEVTPLVPQELLDVSDVPAFFERLEEYDAEFGARINALKERGESLRYLARIDPDGPKVTVGPVGVPTGHPASQLKGSEAFVAFTTERYQDYPLIVRGAGAGGAVTAAGVLADILTVAQTLRGR
jgi:aspartokinase/homoserine dehydrogenase 1